MFHMQINLMTCGNMYTSFLPLSLSFLPKSLSKQHTLAEFSYYITKYCMLKETHTHKRINQLCGTTKMLEWKVPVSPLSKAGCVQWKSYETYAVASCVTHRLYVCVWMHTSIKTEYVYMLRKESLCAHIHINPVSSTLQFGAQLWTDTFGSEVSPQPSSYKLGMTVLTSWPLWN